MVIFPVISWVKQYVLLAVERVAAADSGIGAHASKVSTFVSTMSTLPSIVVSLLLIVVQQASNPASSASILLSTMHTLLSITSTESSSVRLQSTLSTPRASACEARNCAATLA